MPPWTSGNEETSSCLREINGIKTIRKSNLPRFWKPRVRLVNSSVEKSRAEKGFKIFKSRAEYERVESRRVQ